MTKKNIKMVIIDFAGFLKFRSKPAADDGTDPFSFNPSTMSVDGNDVKFGQKLEENAKLLYTFLSQIRKAFPDCGSIGLVCDGTEDVLFQSTLSECLEKCSGAMPIFLKQLAFLNRSRPPDLFAISLDTTLEGVNLYRVQLDATRKLTGKQKEMSWHMRKIVGCIRFLQHSSFVKTKVPEKKQVTKSAGGLVDPFTDSDSE